MGAGTWHHPPFGFAWLGVGCSSRWYEPLSTPARRPIHGKEAVVLDRPRPRSGWTRAKSSRRCRTSSFGRSKEDGGGKRSIGTVQGRSATPLPAARFGRSSLCDHSWTKSAVPPPANPLCRLDSSFRRDRSSPPDVSRETIQPTAKAEGSTPGGAHGSNGGEGGSMLPLHGAAPTPIGPSARPSEGRPPNPVRSPSFVFFARRHP